MDWVFAKDLLERHGVNLIGRKIITKEVGSHPGGIEKILKLTPDKNAPEIVFQVFNYEINDSIGVFDNELVVLL